MHEGVPAPFRKLSRPGVTAALLGASTVALTDFVPLVLHNLRKTMHANSYQRRAKCLNSPAPDANTTSPKAKLDTCDRVDNSWTPPQDSGAPELKTVYLLNHRDHRGPVLFITSTEVEIAPHRFAVQFAMLVLLLASDISQACFTFWTKKTKSRSVFRRLEPG